MPVNLTYPGVFLDELPSAVRTITGVPTAVAAFVGPAARGPVDEPRHLTGWTDFERVYGGLPAGSLMSYCVFHYFQSGGREAEIVRVAARAAPAVIDLHPGVMLEALKPGAAGNNLRSRVDHDPANVAVYKLHFKGASDSETFTINADSTPDKPDSLEQQLSKSRLVRLAPGTARVKPPASPPPVDNDPFGDPAISKGTGGATEPPARPGSCRPAASTRTAPASRWFTPRSTTGSWSRCWPLTTRPRRQNSARPLASSTAPSTTTFAMHA